MKKEIGLWIDHRRAVIVVVTDQGEEVTEISSNMEKHIRFSGGTASDTGSTENMRDRRFGNHLNLYYDRVVALISDADVIQIFGPGEAKGELEKRLEHKKYPGQLLAIEAMDKMTKGQIAEKVRQRFQP